MNASLGYLFTLLITLAIHEGGHVWCAHAFHLPYGQINIGLGPKILTYRKLTFRLLPLGGYVEFPERSRQNRATWIPTLLAGAALNSVCAASSYAIYHTLNAPPEYVTVLQNNGRLQRGDLLLIHHRPIPNTPEGQELGLQLIEQLAQGQRIEVKRGKQNISIEAKTTLPAPAPWQQPPDSTPKPPPHPTTPQQPPKESVTVFAPAENTDQGTLQSVGQSFRLQFQQTTSAIEHTLQGILTSSRAEFSQGLHTPIGLFKELRHLSLTREDLLLFFAALNFSMALINLLPVPVFDGGQVLLLIIEGYWIKKPLNPQVRQRLSLISGGIILLLLLSMAYLEIVN